MADTSTQKAVEKWIVAEYLPTLLGGKFREGYVVLTWGGRFKFDAVSEDGTVVVNISTSSARTSSGKVASGKFHKIKSDTLYLLHAVGARERVQVFTEQGLFDKFMAEQAGGRYPDDVRLEMVQLPGNLRADLETARSMASREVTPR